jgi:hypothetical protein
LNALAGRVTTAEGTIVTHTNNIKDINDRIGTSTDGASKATVYGAIAQVKADLAAEESARSALGTRVGTAEQKLATAESDISGLKTRAGNIESKNSAQDTAIQTAQNKADSAYDQAQTNKNDIVDLTNNFSNYYNKTEVNTIQENLSKAIEDAESGIRDDLNQHIKAANALKYQGGVTATTWPNIKNATAEIGDTYVVTDTIGSFDINNVTTTCHAGDMLIATGSENSEGKIPGNSITWVHVASGYQKEMQGVLSLEDADGSSAAKKVKVALTSLNGMGTKGDLGEFTIESASNNLEITTVAGGMKVQMVWDTF